MPETKWHRKLVVEKRMTWETVDSLRRRFTKMMSTGMLTADGFLRLCALLENVTALFEESTNAAEQARPD